MTNVQRFMQATPDQVWAVLADGWLYATWVVGATRIREVDDSWPEPGARIHHSVGVWPAVVDDTTSVLESEPGSRLVLQARAWPMGEARVELRLTPYEHGTTVEMEETAVRGPGALVPHAAQAPLLKVRNTEALRRLAHLAERRQG